MEEYTHEMVSPKRPRNPSYPKFLAFLLGRVIMRPRAPKVVDSREYHEKRFVFP